MNKNVKLFIVRKYVMADSVAQALKKEKTVAVHEIYVDEEWRKNKQDRLADAIGFSMGETNEKDE